jgi:hypothetical protein
VTPKAKPKKTQTKNKEKEEEEEKKIIKNNRKKRLTYLQEHLECRYFLLHFDRCCFCFCCCFCFFILFIVLLSVNIEGNANLKP